MTIGSKPPLTTTMSLDAGSDAMPGKCPKLFVDAAVRVTQGTATAVGGVDSAVEGDLRRDDEIGLLFAGSFKLPAPAMPGETESLV